MCRAPKDRMSPSLSRALPAAVLAALALSACYVVPIDPRTGQPYPSSNERAPTSGGGVTVITPPVPPGPPQPTVLSARLYPLNQQANLGGMLTAVVVDNHTGRGSFTLGYQGDTLQGEATRVDASYTAFGRVQAEVFGVPPTKFPSGRRGVANAYGPKGVNAQCEYVITGPTLGTGACLFSDGAKYQMHFGN
jgi:hypothetical protein